MWGCYLCHRSQLTNVNYRKIKWSSEKIHPSTYHRRVKTFLETSSNDHRNQLWSNQIGFDWYYWSSQHFRNQLTRWKCFGIREEVMLGFKMEWWSSHAIVFHGKNQTNYSNKCYCGTSNINLRLHMRFQQPKSHILLPWWYHAISRWKLEILITF